MELPSNFDQIHRRGAHARHASDPSCRNICRFGVASSSWVKLTLLGFCLLAGLSHSAKSAIVLSISQSSPGAIPLGNSIDFTVSVQSNSGNISNLANLGFNISVGSGGGQFVSGTGIVPTGSHVSLGPPPSGTLPANQVGYSYSSNTGQLVSGSTATQFVRFRLDTTNATLGNYSITISTADAADLSFNSLGVVVPSAYQYSIVAVPEPGSLMLLPVALVFCGWRARKGR